MNQIRKIFTVIIHEKEYDVYGIEGKEHEGLNGEPKSWWLYYADRLPQGMLPPIDSDSWEPWSSQITRHLWDIRFRQVNSIKEKWNSTNFRNTTIVEMCCNNKLVYQFSTWGNREGLSYAMSKVHYLQVQMSEHPYNFFNPEEERGRKIWWKGLPATVQPRERDGWEIKIYPDYTAGLSKEQWWKELAKKEEKVTSVPDENSEDDLEDRNEAIGDGYINWGDALSDQHINWFRK